MGWITIFNLRLLSPHRVKLFDVLFFSMEGRLFWQPGCYREIVLCFRGDRKANIWSGQLCWRGEKIKITKMAVITMKGPLSRRCRFSACTSWRRGLWGRYPPHAEVQLWGRCSLCRLPIAQNSAACVAFLLLAIFFFQSFRNVAIPRYFLTCLLDGFSLSCLASPRLGQQGRKW